MNVDTFLEARDLYDKYKLCETVLEYLSDEDSVKGQKYLETLKTFVNTFPNDFMMFVHQRMEAVGMEFEAIHCPEHSESEAPIEPPIEEREPIFPIGSKVEIINGIGKGGIGVVKDYDPAVSRYYVVSDNFYMWFAEYELKAYEEESEGEGPNSSFVVGDRVKVLVEPYVGKIGTIVGFDESDNTIAVILDDDDEETYSFASDEIEKIDPETPEENGGTATPDEGE